VDMAALRRLFDLQSGVVNRRQLLELGARDHDIRRWVRQRRLVRVHTGVYVNHTGPLTWINRAWAAVLFHEPAALCDRSALDLAGPVVQVAIEHPRNAASLPGVRLHRLSDLDRKVLWNRTPPRLRVEEAALDVAVQAERPVDAVAVLADLCRRRRTTPQKLLAASELRPRLRHSRELQDALVGIGRGVESALEHAYLTRVEQRHGLPRGRRQVRHKTAAGVVYRDVLHEDYGIIVELDGHLWHSDARVRWSDMTRDLEAAATGRLTVRLGWRHAYDEACQTAARMADLFTTRGWAGRPRRCSRYCTLSGGSQSLGG
jgi:hypothetical protein